MSIGFYSSSHRLSLPLSSAADWSLWTGANDGAETSLMRTTSSTYLFQNRNSLVKTGPDRFILQAAGSAINNLVFLNELRVSGKSVTFERAVPTGYGHSQSDRNWGSSIFQFSDRAVSQIDGQFYPIALSANGSIIAFSSAQTLNLMGTVYTRDVFQFQVPTSSQMFYGGRSTLNGNRLWRVNYTQTGVSAFNTGVTCIADNPVVLGGVVYEPSTVQGFYLGVNASQNRMDLYSFIGTSAVPALQTQATPRPTQFYPWIKADVIRGWSDGPRSSVAFITADQFYPCVQIVSGSSNSLASSLIIESTTTYTLSQVNLGGGRVGVAYGTNGGTKFTIVDVNANPPAIVVTPRYITSAYSQYVCTMERIDDNRVLFINLGEIAGSRDITGKVLQL